MRATTPRSKSCRSRARLSLAAIALAFAACVMGPPARETLLSGETMGSAWTVKIVGELPMPATALSQGIQSRFDAVNLALSTWRADSALSRFNADDRGEWVPIDPELAEVLAYALSLAGRSDGAYDVTVGPLVNLWGFGPDPARFRVPDAAAIHAARMRIGWRKVQVDVAARRARKDPGVRIDLSSLGKGRGVDRVAEYLDATGVTNYLIDLSGKLRARGVNASRGAWRVAVERPEADAGSSRATMRHAIVELRDQSVATAGDYRRFFEADGRHLSHIIDPRSGEPVSHSTLSSTVLAEDCMRADALATMLMVMPPAEALALADRHHLQALLIGRGARGYIQAQSASWASR